MLRLSSKKMIISITSLLSITILSFNAFANTPNHVYQATDDLANNIEKIRLHLKTDSEVRKPGVQIAKTPIHAYTKALEVFEKVQRFKQLQDMSISTTPTLPSKKVTPGDVLVLVKQIVDELELINKKLAIQFTPNAKLPVGKTPSDVYENLWATSYLLDGLAGAISPSYVYRNALRIEKSLLAIAKNLGKNTQISTVQMPKNKKPADANIEGFKVLYQLVNLEKKLKLAPVRVPGFPAGKISPSDVYDTTNNIIAELTRININLSLPPVPNVELSKEKITPNEVVLGLIKIQLLLENILS